MAVSADDVRHVANLARLAIPEEQLSIYVSQLNGILGHMDVLSRISTAGAADEAESGVEGMRTRADTVGAVRLDIPRERFAPLMREGFFLVPRLTTHEDPGAES